MSGYCRCHDSPYSGVDWDIWVSDPNRAWCRTCGLDLGPKEIRREYAIAMSELERVRDKFAGGAAG